MSKNTFFLPISIKIRRCKFFDVFELLLFIVPKGFFYLVIIKYFFLVNFASNKRMENFQFLDQNHGLTNLHKMPIFRLFWTRCFCCQERPSFFYLEYRRTLFLQILPKINRWNILNFWLKTWTNPFKKIPIFRPSTRCFKVQKGFLVHLKYRKTHFLLPILTGIKR